MTSMIEISAGLRALFNTHSPGNVNH